VLLLGGQVGPAQAAGPYPPDPSEVQVTVDRTRVQAGGCVNVLGNGFKPGTQVRVSDDGRFVGVATVNAQTRFTRQVCFSASAKRGRHTLTADGFEVHGYAASGSAAVTVLGIAVSNPSNPPGGGNGNGNGNGGGNGNGTGGFNGTGGTTGDTGVTIPPTASPEPTASASPEPVTTTEPNAGGPLQGGEDDGLSKLMAAGLGLLALLLLAGLFGLLARRRRDEEDAYDATRLQP
jgi:hypothetical protein